MQAAPPMPLNNVKQQPATAPIKHVASTVAFANAKKAAAGAMQLGTPVFGANKSALGSPAVASEMQPVATLLPIHQEECRRRSWPSSPTRHPLEKEKSVG